MFALLLVTLNWLDESQFYMKRKKILQLSYAKTTLFISGDLNFITEVNLPGGGDQVSQTHIEHLYSYKDMKLEA